MHSIAERFVDIIGARTVLALKNMLPESERYLQTPIDIGEQDIRAARFKCYVDFGPTKTSKDPPTPIYEALIDTEWVQCRKSNLFHLFFTDSNGKKHKLLNYLHEHEGHRVNLGIGKRKAQSFDCVLQATQHLIPDLCDSIPQTGNLLFSALPRMLNRKVRLLKPSDWHILADPRFFKNAIADLCANAKEEDLFILQVKLPKTSLHCVAVKSRMIYDDQSDFERLPLVPESFATLQIESILNGFKIQI